MTAQHYFVKPLDITPEYSRHTLKKAMNANKVMLPALFPAILHRPRVGTKPKAAEADDGWVRDLSGILPRRRLRLNAEDDDEWVGDLSGILRNPAKPTIKDDNLCGYYMTCNKPTRFNEKTCTWALLCEKHCNESM
jgi:hypothetical protein